MSHDNFQIIIVVSDKFTDLIDLNINGVMTYSNFVFSLRAGIFTSKTLVYLGQGINAVKANHLRSIISALDTAGNIEMIGATTSKVEKKTVHKEKEENVAITIPNKVSENIYSAELLIDEECAEMMDHVTGIHIQGMLLIEAARQMMMATVEMAAFDSSAKGTYSYVLKTLNIEYFQYLYPVSSEVLCKLSDLKISEKGVLEVTLSVEFYQADQCVCIVSCFAQGYLKDKLKIMESRLAKTCIRAERDFIAKKFENTFNHVPELTVASGQ